MKRMKRHILLMVALAYAMLGVAQRLTVSAPSRVAAGENFRIAYTINTQDVADFKAGNIPSAIEVIAGPYTSSQSSYQMMNGHTSSSSSITYTYTLYATKNGTYTISPAKAVVHGKTITSPALKISVVGTAKPTASGAPKLHDYDNDDDAVRAAGSKISGNDLFIRVSASKKRVREQEPVLLSYKVYSLVELTQLNGKMPDLNGFHTQEVKLPTQKSFHLERLNGKNYKCVTWSQYVMYPQMSGELKIPSIKFDGIVVQRNRSVDPFEAIFNGGSGYVELKKEIEAPGLTLQVDPLPARPENFSGGVGNFTISAQLNKKEAKTGEPLNLRIVVSGSGNLKLLKAPIVNFPKSFDKYDVKVTDKTHLTTNGIEGNMIYDFLAVPQQIGKYDIPPTEFVFYDTKKQQYHTIRTQRFSLKIEKGTGTSSEMSKFEEEQNKDIRPIMQGPAVMMKAKRMFFTSALWFILLFVIVAVTVAIFVVLRQRQEIYSDSRRLRGSKANKMATRRLKLAGKLMEECRQNEFYDEVLHALWGYVSDKLSISAEQLTRQNIAETLNRRTVNAETVESFIAAIDECEYERYAPGDSQGNMSKTYDMAVKAIMDIEATMKSNKKASALVLLALVMSTLPLATNAATKTSADQEYKRGNYPQAIADYKSLLKKTPSAEVYYNLGNAYFRSDSIPQAILAYERAALINPGNSYIRFNLQFARGKTIDKVAEPDEMFFISWFRSAANLATVDGWATMVLISAALLGCCILLYFFSSRILVRKVGFGCAIAFAILFVLSNIFALYQKNALTSKEGAIIMAPAANLKKTPIRSGADEAVLHEGTRVDIADRSIKGWLGVKLADGREGWIEENTVEEI
ncbi:BatD family protein [Hoylesella loescheii]|uniref:BatD family protein n=1 Tax=Hoylesella loescheii TaxID=840 RepID=UPI00248D81A2|nr:BatD family protein [Hoylesella loescheii]